VTPQWFLAAGYSDTFASRANGIADRALPPAVVRAGYALSKRTAIYLIEARQLARGQTLGQTAPSSMPSPRSAIRRTARRRRTAARRW
jgi:predicted porin